MFWSTRITITSSVLTIASQSARNHETVFVFLKEKPWTDQYLWALFKALSHMLCIGYGRHPPQNIPEACVTIFSMMTGATFYALFIAYSINVIQQIDSPSRQFREKVIFWIQTLHLNPKLLVVFNETFRDGRYIRFTMMISVLVCLVL